MTTTIESRKDTISKAQRAFDAAVKKRELLEEQLEWLRAHNEQAVEFKLGSPAYYSENVKDLQISVTLSGARTHGSVVHDIGERLCNSASVLLWSLICREQESTNHELRQSEGALETARQDLAAALGVETPDK